jgi:hypothetical protein
MRRLAGCATSERSLVEDPGRPPASAAALARNVSADWLNGAGLVCNMAGVLMIFLYGVPAYRPLADARKSYLLLLEEDDPEQESRTNRASLLSKLGLGLLGAGFVLQFVALFT